MTSVRPKVNPDGRYSVIETARLLDVSRVTIYRWRKTGYLKAKKSRLTGKNFFTGREILKFFSIW